METIVTPEFRLSFPAVFKARSFEGGKEKFSIKMLFDKEQLRKNPEFRKDFDKLKAYVAAFLAAEFPDDKDECKPVFNDGDKKSWAGYAGCIYCGASSMSAPWVVDQFQNKIISETYPDGLYAGCYARAVLHCFAYNVAGNKGVALGLDGIQKLRDGEPFTGRVRPEDVLTPLDGVEAPPPAADVDDLLL